MYKVFINNSEIILTTEKEYSKDILSLSIKDVNLQTIISHLLKNPGQKIHLYGKSYEKIFKILFKKIPVIEASGGKVYNANNDILFIYRNNTWDLPKGKIEKDESITNAALREVQEETGVLGLEVVRFLQRTYHIYQYKGKYVLKVTYWFEMMTNQNTKLIAQEEEGITEVCWKNQNEAKEALKNTYASIKQLFPREYFV